MPLSFESSALASAEYPVRFQSFLQPANPYRFRGEGVAAAGREVLRLSGEQSRPFWFSSRTTVEIPFYRICDVETKGKKVSFGVEPEPGKKITRYIAAALFFENEESAEAFAAALPKRVSEQGADKRKFESQLAATSRPWLVPVLVAANVLVYALLGVRGAGWIVDDPKALIAWGSNFGPLTSDGQWWRLLSACFLHGGLVHLLVNMVTLYDLGRLCERIYGSGRFLALYLASGLLASAASVWWNPMVHSVGASGAILGVLGATFAYMLDKRNGIPVSVMKSHTASVGVFIAYGLVNGLTNTGIDKAAHIGGLATGVVMGIAFARPLDAQIEIPGYWRRAATGLIVTIAALAFMVSHTVNTSAAFELDNRFRDDLAWYQIEEKVLVSEGQQFAARAKQPGVNEAELKPVMQNLANRWAKAYDRLSAYKLAPSSPLYETHRDMVAFLDLRSRAMAMSVEVFDAPDRAELKLKDVNRLMKESNAVIERMQGRNKKHAR